MRSGLLRHLLQIENLIVSDAGSRGQENGTRVIVGETYASIEQLTAREQEIAHERGINAEYKITCRYHPDLTEQSKLIFGERVFSVLGSNNVDERNKQLILLCGETR